MNGHSVNEMRDRRWGGGCSEGAEGREGEAREMPWSLD